MSENSPPRDTSPEAIEELAQALHEAYRGGIAAVSEGQPPLEWGMLGATRQLGWGAVARAADDAAMLGAMVISEALVAERDRYRTVLRRIAERGGCSCGEHEDADDAREALGGHQ